MTDQIKQLEIEWISWMVKHHDLETALSVAEDVLNGVIITGRITRCGAYHLELKTAPDTFEMMWVVDEKDKIYDLMDTVFGLDIADHTGEAAVRDQSVSWAPGRGA
jgi:hypothetical protein